MRILRNVTISVRSQAAIVFILTAAWCSCLYGCIRGMDTPQLICETGFILLPFLITIFAVILPTTCLRGERNDVRLVYGAVLAAVSVWVLGLGYKTVRATA